MKRLALFLFIITSILTAQSSYSNDLPPYYGLEDTLPLSFLEDHPFIEFESFREAPRAPIGVRILFNGSPAKDLSRVFSEKFLASIPITKTILTETNEFDEVVWDYPIGTQLVHII